MAIVFISPKKKQQVIVFAIVGIFITALVVAGLLIFLSKPQPVAPTKVFHPPKIKINFSVLESKALAELEPFENRVKKVFGFEAVDQDDNVVTGEVVVASEGRAKQVLKEKGFSKIKIILPKVGRDNPFVSPK